MNCIWTQEQQGIIMLYFYHVIPLIIIYVMTIPIGGHYGMNVF